MRFVCPKCGQHLEIEDGLALGDVQCPACAQLVRPPAMPTAYAPAIAGPAFVEAPRTAGFAVASLVMGIIGITVGWLCCSLLFPLLAIVFGHIALAQIGRRPAELRGRGMAIAGLVLGYVSFVVSLVLGLFFGVFAAIMEAAEKNM